MKVDKAWTLAGSSTKGVTCNKVSYSSAAQSHPAGLPNGFGMVEFMYQQVLEVQSVEDKLGYRTNSCRKLAKASISSVTLCLAQGSPYRSIIAIYQDFAGSQSWLSLTSCHPAA